MKPISSGLQVPVAAEMTAREAACNVMRRLLGYGRNRCTVFVDRAGGLRVRTVTKGIPERFQPIAMIGTFSGSTPFDEVVLSCSRFGLRYIE